MSMYFVLMFMHGVEEMLVDLRSLSEDGGDIRRAGLDRLLLSTRINTVKLT